MVISIKTVAKLVAPNFRNLAERSGRPQLVTIAFSHYNDLARWTLQVSKIDFDEYGYAPGAHVLPALSVRVGGEKKEISTSSKVESIRGGKGRNSSATAVPLMVMPDKTVLRDSWEIAEYATGQTLDPKLKDILDNRLGPQGRSFAYSVCLNPAQRELWDKLVYQISGPIYSTIWRFYAGDTITKGMIKEFATDDEDLMRGVVGRLKETFDQVGEFLPDDGYIGGASPNLSDFAVASLASAAVIPKGYCGGAFDSIFSKILENASESEKQDRNHFRDHKVGKHCELMYGLHR